MGENKSFTVAIASLCFGEKVPWVLNQKFQWFICMSFSYVQTLHRDKPDSWG